MLIVQIPVPQKDFATLKLKSNRTIFYRDNINVMEM